MAKLKLKLEERLRALDLLKQNHTVESAVDHLHANFHPEREREEVARAYFPFSGIFAISKLVGGSDAEIEARAKEIKCRAKEFANSGRDKITNLNNDPTFQQEHRKRARKLMEKINETNPGRDAKVAERMRVNRANPSFEAKRLANLSNYKRKLKLSIDERLRVLELLKQGHSVARAVNYLREHFHPDCSATKIKRAYFPKKGPFVISHLIDATGEEIEIGKKRLITNAQNLALTGAENASVLNDDPLFRQKLSSLLKKQRRNSKFLAALKKGYAEHVRRLKQKKLISKGTNEVVLELPKRGFENGRPVPISEPSVDDDFDRAHKLSVLTDAISELSDHEQRVLKVHFELGINGVLTPEEVSQIPEILNKLMMHPNIHRLF